MPEVGNLKQLLAARNLLPSCEVSRDDEPGRGRNDPDVVDGTARVRRISSIWARDIPIDSSSSVAYSRPESGGLGVSAGRIVRFAAASTAMTNACIAVRPSGAEKVASH
jgi:hypothetical protein